MEICIYLKQFEMQNVFYIDTSFSCSAIGFVGWTNFCIDLLTREQIGTTLTLPVRGKTTCSPFFRWIT